MGRNALSLCGEAAGEQGLVIQGTNNVFSVETESGPVVRCSIKGKILRQSSGFYNPLAPGDCVEFSRISGSEDEGVILSLAPRKNRFTRWNEKGNAPQILAANLDAVAVVTSADAPPFRPRFVDRVLVQAGIENIPPLVVVNKCDLPVDPDVYARVSDWQRIGYTVFFVSASTGEGLDALRAALAGKRSAFIGQSGVGKSSLLNALCGSAVNRTAAISCKYRRGVHTTTRGALFHAASGGFQGDLIDTPGIRHFRVYGISSADLIYYFPEMEKLAGRCLYGMSCTHGSEPGCKIQEAVYSGVIAEDRLESWSRIAGEL